MQDIDLQKITIDPLTLPLFNEKKIEADVLRLDKIHSLVSGNKWFKLRYYLEEAKALNATTIVTKGGAWSNHILATAAACKMNGLGSIGIIRGEMPAIPSPVLDKAKEMGMQFFFTDRSAFREEDIPAELDHPGNYFIPTGGHGIKGTQGAATICDHYKKNYYTHVCCAAGTGTMAAGLINTSPASEKIIVINVLKNNGLENDIMHLTSKEKKNWEINHDYHFGGYAKYKNELIDFMNELYRHTMIPLDFVYTGKLFFAINDLVLNDLFPGGSRLLLIHSGGLQGNSSFSKGTLIF